MDEGDTMIMGKEIKPLFLTASPAAKYLGCSKDELLAWIAPDRRSRRSNYGGRLWLASTLDAARPHVATWRERDRAAIAARIAEQAATEAAAKARRKGMRKGGAVTAKAACERLGCSLTELNRWAADDRLPPDGEIVLFGALPKTVHARAWLPDTIETAKASLADWRARDSAQKVFKRRGLRLA